MELAQCRKLEYISLTAKRMSVTVVVVVVVNIDRSRSFSDVVEGVCTYYYLPLCVRHISNYVFFFRGLVTRARSVRWCLCCGWYCCCCGGAGDAYFFSF